MTPPLIESIYQKYISIFYEIDNGAIWIDLSAVRYAMRAALREMAAAQPAADIIEEHRHLDATVRRIERVLEAHDSDAYAEFAAGQIDLPTAIDAMIASHRNALAESHAKHLADVAGKNFLGNQTDYLRAELDALRQQLAQMDADNARLTDELRTVRSWSVAPTRNSYPTAILTAEEAAAQTANGKTRTVAEMLAAIAPEDNASWNDAMLSMLDAETADYWHGIAAGRWTWRKLPKSTRLAMVRHVLSFGPEDRAMSMSEFDAIRPAWMPGAGSHPITFGVPWSTLSDMRVEIEVTP